MSFFAQEGHEEREAATNARLDALGLFERWRTLARIYQAALLICAVLTALLGQSTWGWVLLVISIYLVFLCCISHSEFKHWELRIEMFGHETRLRNFLVQRDIENKVKSQNGP